MPAEDLDKAVTPTAPLMTLAGEAANVFLSHVTPAGVAPIEPGTYRLVVPPRLVAGYMSHAIRAATPRAGDASVLLKNVSSGKIVGHALLWEAAEAPRTAAVSPVPVVALGLTDPTVALALVMGMIVIGELHAMNDKLRAISGDIHELVVIKRAELTGQVAAARQKLGYAEGAVARGAELNEMFVDLQISMADETEQARLTCRALLSEGVKGYDAGASGPPLEEFCRFAEATEVAASACTFLLSLPKAASPSIDAYLRASEDRLAAIVTEMREESARLVDISDRYEAAVEKRREFSRAPRARPGLMGELVAEARDLTRLSQIMAGEAAARTSARLGKADAAPLPDAVRSLLAASAGRAPAGVELELEVGNDAVALLGVHAGEGPDDAVGDPSLVK